MISNPCETPCETLTVWAECLGTLAVTEPTIPDMAAVELPDDISTGGGSGVAVTSVFAGAGGFGPSLFTINGSTAGSSGALFADAEILAEGCVLLADGATLGDEDDVFVVEEVVADADCAAGSVRDNGAAVTVTSGFGAVASG